MDGAMHKAVLIILAAVVALIVIVVLTGMRYLRADDEDEFDDEIAAERGQSRGRSDHPARDHWRVRHHDDEPGDAHGQRLRGDRDGVMRGAGGRDRAERDGLRPGAFVGVGAGRGSSRDNVGLDDSMGASLGRGNGRDGLSRQPAGRDGALRGASGRDGRDAMARDDVVRTSDRRGAARDLSRDGDRRDSSGRGHDRGWDDSSYVGREDRRGQRASDNRELAGWDSPSRDSNGRDSNGRDSAGSGRDDRERRGSTGPNARPEGRKATSSQSRRDDSLPDVRPRAAKNGQGKSKRDSDGDWPSTEWDELSDVDYWAELASDKPLTTSAQPATPPARSERDRDRTEARPATDGGSSRERRDTADRRAFAAAPAESADSGFATRTESYGGTEQRRAITAGTESARTSAPSGRTSISGAHRVPQPLDDDPLTSPSFPRVAADDSRSYRRSRSEDGSNGRQPETQTGPHSGHQAVPPHPPVAPLDGRPALSRPSSGYSAPPTNGAGYPVAAGPADPYSQPGTQVSDPYFAPAAGGYPADSVTAAYSAPMPPGPGSYLPALPAATSYQGPDSSSYSVPMASPPLPGQSVPSSASYADASYADGHDGAGYYAGGNPGDQPSYPAYPSGAGAAPSAGPQAQLAQYAYSQPADVGYAGQLPAAQPPVGYGGYQPPAQTDMAGIYQVQGTQPGVMPPGGGVAASYSPPGLNQVEPGYPSAPYTAAPYEPAGYPTRGYEPETGLPADPYAVDPYGYPGYGSARLEHHQWHGRVLQKLQKRSSDHRRREGWLWSWRRDSDRERDLGGGARFSPTPVCSP
jgi:hypothetical protein